MNSYKNLLFHVLIFCCCTFVLYEQEAKRWTEYNSNNHVDRNSNKRWIGNHFYIQKIRQFFIYNDNRQGFVKYDLYYRSFMPRGRSNRSPSTISKLLLKQSSRTLLRKRMWGTKTKFLSALNQYKIGMKFFADTCMDFYISLYSIMKISAGKSLFSSW